MYLVVINPMSYIKFLPPPQGFEAMTMMGWWVPRKDGGPVGGRLSLVRDATFSQTTKQLAVVLFQST